VFFRQALIGMMQLLAVFAFFAIGFVCVSLPFFTHLRLQAANILFEESRLLIWVGVAFFSFALLLTLGFFSLSKGRFLLLRMGEHTTEIDVRILKKAIPPMLTKQLSGKVRLRDVEVFKNRELRIGLTMAPMEDKEKETILLDAEYHLQTLLSERFGYSRPFIVQLKE